MTWCILPTGMVPITVLVAVLITARETVSRQYGPFSPENRVPALTSRPGRRVEEERGAGPTGSRPFPFPAHQTGLARFEHPAFRQTSPSAHGGFRHEKTQYTKFPEHNSVRVLGSAQRGHFVAT